MAKTENIPADLNEWFVFLHECFREEAGRLWWRERPRDHFQSERACNAWNTRFAGQEAGGLDYNSNSGYRWRVNLFGTGVYRHRIIWALHKREWLYMLDHKNCNSLDDRIDNLRVANDSLNKANCKLRCDNTSGMKGVYWHKQSKKWVASIGVNGVRHYLGLFDNINEAQQAYLEAAKNFFGDFAHGGTS